MKNDVLYQIKKFNQFILRYFIHNMKGCENNFSNIPTPTQIQIIDYLIEHQEEEIFQRDLENVLQLRRATVSGVLKTMEKNFFIERVTSSMDARIKKIVLKDSALKVFEETKQRFQMISEFVCEGISNRDLEVFCRVIEQMQKNLEHSMSVVALKGKE